MKQFNVSESSAWFARVLAAIAFFWSGLAFAQALNAGGKQFDCLIEPHAVIKVGSPVEGILAELTVDRGDIVKSGAILAKLESGVEEATVDLARARAENDVAMRSNEARRAFEKRKLARTQKLSDKKVVSSSALDEAETNSRLAEFGLSEARFDVRIAQLELARAQEVLERRTIRSPVDGVVVERLLLPGEYAHDQAQLMTIAQMDPLNVEVFVPISEYERILPAMEAEVRPEEPIGGVYRAQVSIVDRVFDAGSGTFGVRLLLPNPEYRLPAGLRCTVTFLMDSGLTDSK